MLAAEGVFAVFVPLLVGPVSDATQTSFGRRRPVHAPRARPDGGRARERRLHVELPRDRRSRCSRSSSPTTSTSRRTAASTRTCSTPACSGGRRASSTSTAGPRSGRAGRRGLPARALGAGAVRSRRGVVLVACGATILFVREHPIAEREHERLRTYLGRALARRQARAERPPLPDRQHGLGGDVRGHADVRRPLHHRRPRPAPLRLVRRARGRRGRVRDRSGPVGPLRRPLRPRQRHPGRLLGVRARPADGRLRADLALVVLRAHRARWQWPAGR